MKLQLRKLVCRVLGHAELVRSDYDLSAGKVVVERCRRCSALLGVLRARGGQYPLRRIV